MVTSKTIGNSHHAERLAVRSDLNIEDTAGPHFGALILETGRLPSHFLHECSIAAPSVAAINPTPLRRRLSLTDCPASEGRKTPQVVLANET
ncbi:MAG: hypothetical protein AAF664_24050 [Planctomycetota bacterium]